MERSDSRDFRNRNRGRLWPLTDNSFTARRWHGGGGNEVTTMSTPEIPKADQAPAVDVDAIRDAVDELSQWIAGTKTAEILNRIRAALPPKPLKWAPVMVTETGEPVVVGSYNPEARWREVWRGDGATWIVDDDGQASSDTGDYPRIVGPWRPEDDGRVA